MKLLATVHFDSCCLCAAFVAVFAETGKVWPTAVFCTVAAAAQAPELCSGIRDTCTASFACMTAESCRKLSCSLKPHTFSAWASLLMVLNHVRLQLSGLHKETSTLDMSIARSAATSRSHVIKCRAYFSK